MKDNLTIKNKAASATAFIRGSRVAGTKIKYGLYWFCCVKVYSHTAHNKCVSNRCN